MSRAARQRPGTVARRLARAPCGAARAFVCCAYSEQAKILSYRDKDAEALDRDGVCHRSWRSFRSVAERKLDMLNAAAVVGDLRTPPGNRLEKLSGAREGRWSIRINDQWRICFRWDGAGPEEFEIVDYH